MKPKESSISLPSSSKLLGLIDGHKRIGRIIKVTQDQLEEWNGNTHIIFINDDALKEFIKQYTDLIS
jgi:hypothetical protein